MFQGVNASDGIGIGVAQVAVEPDLSYSPKPHGDPDAEAERYNQALNKFVEHTRAQAKRMAESVGEEEAQIMVGHINMAQDPFMIDEIQNRIQQGMAAEQATDETLLDLIMDSSQAYLAGTKTLDETASLIQSKVSLYVSEQYG